MKESLRVLIPALAVIAGIAPHALAQCDRCGLAILASPGGARPVGLAGAFVAGDGPDVLFYNPAQVGSGNGASLNLERVGGGTLTQFAASSTFGGFGVGAGVRFVASGAPPVAAGTNPLPAGGLVAGVGVATKLHGVWLGVAGNFVTPDLGSATRGAAFDVGAAIRRFGLLLAASAQNLGSDLAVGNSRAELPRRVSVGATLQPQFIGTYFDLGASAAVSLERGGLLVPKAGIELVFTPVSGWTLTGRVGARRSTAEAGMPHQSPLALGGSFGLDNVTLDYAFLPGSGGSGAVHTVGLRIQ